jgi:toxin ParE1/3/4
MAEVIFSPEAAAQLECLEEYLASRFYPGNAARYVERIVAACRGLGLAPNRGIRRDDLGEGIRLLGFETRVAIYFRITDKQVVILGIHYGGQVPSGFR